MRRLSDAGRIVSLLLALTALPCCGSPAPEREQAPANLDDALTQLTQSFEAAKVQPLYSSNPSPHGDFQTALDANREHIEGLLAPARTSPAYARDLAEMLLSPLRAYAERFRPGSTIDESVLGKTTFAMGEAFDYGLGLRAHLLLELVKQQRSAALAREAFAALDEVIRADSHLVVQRQLYRHRADPDVDIASALAREREEFGGENPSWLGWEIAGHCEAFLTDLYLSDEPPYLPSAAMSRVEAYWRWRKETMLIDNSPERLEHFHMFATVNCVRDLATLLQEASLQGITGNLQLAPQEMPDGTHPRSHRSRKRAFDTGVRLLV